MRSFSLVLLRRLLFRSAPGTSPTPPATRLTLYDHLSHQTLATLERLLLFSLSHEASSTVRRKCVDTVCDLANQGMMRGRPWHALQAQAFNMTHSQTSERGEVAAGLREIAYRVFAGCSNLVMDLQVDAVLSAFQRGLQDQESIEVGLFCMNIAFVFYKFRSDTLLSSHLWRFFLLRIRRNYHNRYL